MITAILASLVSFGLGCYAGNRLSTVSYEIDRVLLSVLGPPDPENPGWWLTDNLTDEEKDVR